MNLKLILILSVSHLFTDITSPSLPVILPLLKTALKLNYTEVGSVIMISNITSSIIQPAFGYLSDRREMKWLLPLSTVLAFSGFSLVGVSSSYAALVFFVMLNGVGVACYHPEAFKIMHYFTGHRRATGMSLFQVGGALGMAFGPLAMTYALQAAHLRGTLLFPLMGIPVLILLLIYYKEFTHPLQNQAVPGPAARTARAVSAGSRAWPSMTLLVLAVAMRSWTQMGLTTFVPFYYITVLHGDPITAGRLLFTFLMGGAVGTLGGAFVADRIGHKLYFWLSMIVTMPLLVLMLIVSGGWIFAVLFFAGVVLISSYSVTVVMGQRILANRLGMASGLMLGFVIGMGGIGAGLLGMVADAWGITAVMKIIAVMPLIGFLIVLLIPYPSDVRK